MPLLDAFIPTPGHGYTGDIRDIRILDNPRLRRPYLDEQDRPCVTVNTGKWTVEKGERVPLMQRTLIRDLMNAGHYDPVWLTANATSFRKEQWIYLDQQVEKEARPRLKAWATIAGKNSFGGFPGMSKMTLEYEAMSDPGEAVVDFDGLTEARGDSPRFKLRSLPLPITHSDFWFSQRRLDISKGSTPLDTTMAEAAGRRVAEMVEKMTIGVETGPSYGYNASGVTAHDISAPDDGHGSALGGSQVYGLVNYPHRLTKTNFTAPSAGGWVPDTTRNEILTAINSLATQNFYGPFAIFHSIDWSPYMERVYNLTGGTGTSETLRTMLLKTEGIDSVTRLDFLTSTFTLLIVQMTSDVVRAVNGMDITTVQWPTIGGMRVNFKIMCIWVPHVRSTFSGKCGILHGTTA